MRKSGFINKSIFFEQAALGLMYLLIAISALFYTNREEGYVLLALGSGLLFVIQLLISLYLYDKGKRPDVEEIGLLKKRPKNLWNYISYTLFFIVIGISFYGEDYVSFLYILLVIVAREIIVFFSHKKRKHE